MGPIFDVVYRPDETARTRPTGAAAWLHRPAASTPHHWTAWPPALIVTCGTDILREVGIRYAERLDQAGSLREHIDLPEVGLNLIGATRQTMLPVYERIAEEVRQRLALRA